MKKKMLILIGLAISSITSCAPNPESYDVVTVSYCPVYDIVCDDDYTTTTHWWIRSRCYRHI